MESLRIMFPPAAIHAALNHGAQMVMSLEHVIGHYSQTIQEFTIHMQVVHIDVIGFIWIVF